MVVAEYVKTEHRKPSEVSTAEDSSWRDLDEILVAGHVATIEAGNYMATSMEQPSLLAEGGNVLVSSHDGGGLLRNGKHWMEAMKRTELKVAAMAAEAKDSCDWLTPLLRKHLEVTGLPLQVFEYAGRPYDRLMHRMLECYKHEDSQNALAKTTCGERAATANMYFAKNRQDWSLARADMLETMGTTRVSTVDRWISLARDVPDGVMEYIARWRDIPQAFFLQNQYLMGVGEKKRYRLGKEWAKVAFDWRQYTIEDSLLVSTEQFHNVYCLAAKHGESWAYGLLKRYGVTASSFAAYHRGVEWLKTPLGFAQIKRWLASPELKKQPNFADASLNAMVEEMKKVFAGTSKAAGGEAPRQSEPVQTNQGAGQSAPASGAGQSAPAADEDGDDEASFGMEVDAAARPADPVAARAAQMAEEDLVFVSVYANDGDRFHKDLATTVFPSSKPVVWIQAPTSRAKILTDFVSELDSLPVTLAPAALYVPLGERIALIATIKATLQTKWPKRSSYIVQVAGGKQSRRRRATYGVYVPSTEDEEAYQNGIPTSISLVGCRASSREGLRERCLDGDCGLRSVTVPDDKLQGAPDSEIPVEDQECGDEAEDWFEVQEDDDVGEAGAGESAPLPGAGESAPIARTCKRNLYPYACPIAVDVRVLKEVCLAPARTHLIVYSRTAHPGIVVAGRECGLKVMVLLRGCHQHSVAHGQALLKSLLAQRKLTAAKALLEKEGVKVKRGRDQDVQQIEALAESALQLVRVMTVEPKDASKWRGGLNRATPADLEDKILKQLNSELEAHKLQLRQDTATGGIVSLCAGKAFREGDVIAPLGGITFDSKERMLAFLDSGEVTMALSSAVVRIDNVYLNDENPPQVGSLFRVLTGVGRYVRHYTSGQKARPNAVLKVSTEEGCNDWLLSLVAHRENKGGIVRGGPILLDYGKWYDHDLAVKLSSAPPAKRLRSMLDSFFHKAAVDAVMSSPVKAAGESASGGTDNDAASAAGESAPGVGESGPASAAGESAPAPANPPGDSAAGESAPVPANPPSAAGESAPRPLLRDGELIVGKLIGEFDGTIYFRKATATNPPVVGLAREKTDTNKKLKPQTMARLEESLSAGEVVAVKERRASRDPRVNRPIARPARSTRPWNARETPAKHK